MSRLKTRLVNQEVNHPIIQTIELIRAERLAHASLTDLPPELMNMIFNYFARSDGKGWGNLYNNNHFLSLFKNPTVAHHLLKNNFVPENKKLEFIKSVGPFLTELDLNDSTISDQELKEIFKFCPNIQFLDLSWCRNLTDAAIKDLPKNLQTLNLSDCSNLTDAAIKDLPKDLQTLNLSCRI